MQHRAVLRLALLEVALGAVEVRRVERRHLALRAGPAVEPAEGVLRDVVDVEIERRDRDVVAGADAEAVARRDAVLVALRSGVVGLAVHQVEAEGRRLAEPRVGVHGRAPVAAVAERADHVGLVHELGPLRDLVDHPAGRAATEQHRRGAAHHLDAFVVERVALVGRRVAQAVDQDVAGGGEREAAQPDVLVGAVLGRRERDARRVVQRFLERVELEILDDLLGQHRDRLRDVADVLVALAHGRRGGAHRVRVGLLAAVDRDAGQLRVGFGHRGPGTTCVRVLRFVGDLGVDPLLRPGRDHREAEARGEGAERQQRTGRLQATGTACGRDGMRAVALAAVLGGAGHGRILLQTVMRVIRILSTMTTRHKFSGRATMRCRSAVAPSGDASRSIGAPGDARMP